MHHAVREQGISATQGVIAFAAPAPDQRLLALPSACGYIDFFISIRFITTSYSKFF